MSRRPRLSFAVPLLVAASAATAVPSASAQIPPKPKLAATVTTCTTGLTAADRAAVFTGTMPAYSKAVSMGMRFDLDEREGTIGPFRRRSAPTFGRYEKSQPGVAGFSYTKRLEGLRVPAAYRVTVRFRWYDAKGRVVRRSRRTSAICEQPDLRPDLRVAKLTIDTVAGTDGLVGYSATVRNVGVSATAGDVLVGLSTGGVAQSPVRLGPLGAGGAVTVAFRAPRCADGMSVAVTADVEDVVEESDETDNVVRRACPVA